MGELDVLLSPVYPTPAPLHGEAFSSKEAGDDTTYAYLVNHVDVLPGGTLRVATSKEKQMAGLPIGIQIVGSPFAEHKVLRIMKELEREFGGYQPPPNIALGGESQAQCPVPSRGEAERNTSRKRHA
jgi:Asp-tRNA(Asn)/Glu-tRNA(Gln) amidotransferase A subunit family amidase